MTARGGWLDPLLGAWKVHQTNHPRAPEEGVLGLLLLLLAVAVLKHSESMVWVAFGVVIGASLFPGCRQYVAFVWWMVGRAAQFAVSPLVLAIVFFLVLTPWSFVFRRFGGDPLRLDGQRRTQLQGAARVAAAGDFKDPF